MLAPLLVRLLLSLLCTAHPLALLLGYVRRDAWVLVLSFSFIIVFMNLARLSRKMRPIIMFGRKVTRYHLIATHVRCDEISYL